MAEHLYPFLGRTISVVNDLTLEEQLYLYAKASRLKDCLRRNQPSEIDKFRIKDNNISINLLFMSPSSRTKMSFLNSAQFHRVKVNDFDVSSSSFSKKESITDTVRMLSGYSSKQSIFVIRSSQEGTCAWLKQALQHYAKKMQLPMPAMINAGDGHHSHPTHEYFDQFTFLEQLGWCRESIHIALIGDLFHRRLAHSKVDGLRVFRTVRVDLVAPDDLQLPESLVQRMVKQGFEVRVFPSLDEYLFAGDCASVMYFTTVHFEQFGDKLKDRQGVIKDAITFRTEWCRYLPPHAKLYHRFPRLMDEGCNTVPEALRKTEFNGWDEEVANSFFIRTVLLGMIGGQVGSDFSPFVEIIPARNGPRDAVDCPTSPESERIQPLENGLVIDHIGIGLGIQEIWATISKVRKLLKLNVTGSHGVFETRREGGSHKGIISLPNHTEFSHHELRRLAAIAPDCTLNIVEENAVTVKYRMHMPPRVYNFKDLACKNELCISHAQHFENVTPHFERVDGGMFVCIYCQRSHRYQDIWQ